MMTSIVRRCVALSFLAGLALHSVNVPAQDTTVKVGKQTKRASGTIVSMEAGDVACYVNLKTDAGVTFQEMADFEICEQEQALKGKRVALTYVVGKVMAASCQGNPDCKKTQTVALISAVKVLRGAAPQPPANASSTPAGSR